ncbi:MAG TPA: hypothetical protein PKG52_07075 [bacterium]|nr:hypothetical protein [bacterium]HPS31085.1 hypothetical protein [bacterium]
MEETLYEIAEITGFVNVALFFILASAYLFLKFMSPKNKMKRYIFKLHPYIGILFMTSVVTHGYLMLRGFQWHTGTVLGIIIFLSIISYAVLKRNKWKKALLFHHITIIIIFLAMTVHLIWPALI